MNQSTRDAYGKKLAELGGRNDRVVVFGADLDDSNKIQEFERAFPNRFFKSGISEAHMVSRALGWGYEGFIPVINSFAVFGSHRGYDQIFQGLRKKTHALFVFSHAGLGVGQDGESAQAIADIALMASIPGVRYVFDPVDAQETAAMVEWAVMENDAPAYIRTRRQDTPVLGVSFSPGKPTILKEGDEAAIVACGPIVNHALDARLDDVKIIALSTVKPIDAHALEQSIGNCPVVFTLEDHSIRGGLGDAVAMALEQKVHRLGMDSYGATGRPEELYARFGLDAAGIRKSVERLLG